MSAKILDGRLVAQIIQASLKEQVDYLNKQGVTPGLTVIIVGNDPASCLYVQNKHKACQAVGMRSVVRELPEETTQKELLSLIQSLNEDKETQGILLQLPLPNHLNATALLEAIDPHKDVDGFHPYNLGRLAQRRPALRPCTPYGIMQLLKYYEIDVKGLTVTIVGASNIVGRPMALELLLEGATVTICHRFTKNLAFHVEQADILISAIGKPGVVQAEWIKQGTIVIDVGINRLADGRVVGDIDFEKAKNRASWITPVPGGVGPMTIAMLLSNTVEATKLSFFNC